MYINMKAMLLTIAAAGMLGVVGCQGGHEGDRCNPALTAVNEDECNKGLSCQQPTNCAESYCCPADGGHSDNPFCNGAASACPVTAPTTGDDAASEAASDAGGDAAGEAGDAPTGG